MPAILKQSMPRGLLMAVAAVLLAGCGGTGPGTNLFSQNVIGTEPGSGGQNGNNARDSTGLVPGLPKGFQCPFVPNGFDPVGSIYRIDRSGTYYRVADLSNDKVVLKNIKSNVKIGNYVFNDTQKASAHISVSLLKRILPGLSGDAKSNTAFDIGITVKNMHAKVLYDKEADYIRDWFAKHHRPKAGNRYFLVREAIFAGSVAYSMRAKDLKTAGIKAKVEQVVDSAANATFTDRGRHLVIEQTFDPPTQVCIKVAEIEIGGTTRSGDQVATALKPTEGEKLPLIKRIGQ